MFRRTVVSAHHKLPLEYWTSGVTGNRELNTHLSLSYLPAALHVLNVFYLNETSHRVCPCGFCACCSTKLHTNHILPLFGGCKWQVHDDFEPFFIHLIQLHIPLLSRDKWLSFRAAVVRLLRRSNQLRHTLQLLSSDC